MMSDIWYLIHGICYMIYVCVCVCVCVCVGVGVGVGVVVCMCMHMHMPMYVCVCTYMHMAMYTHSMCMYIYIYNIWVHYRKTNLFGWQTATRWFHIQIFPFSTRDAWVPWPGELVERCWDQMLLANRRFDDRFNAAFYRLERVRSWRLP